MKLKFLRTYLVLFILMSFLSGCEIDNKQIVANYFDALNKADLKGASQVIHDSIKMYEFEFEQVNMNHDWYRQFKWDSVFSPVYEIIEMNEIDGKVEATISKNCLRISFLHDSAIVIKSVFEFREGKIISENTYEFIVFDFDKWQSRRDTLVAWTENNHPELSGFIYDQTVKGGQNYLKAIDYYEREQ